MIFPDIPDYWDDNDTDETRLEFVWTITLEDAESELLDVSDLERATSITFSAYFLMREDGPHYLMSEWEMRDGRWSAIGVPVKNPAGLFRRAGLDGAQVAECDRCVSLLVDFAKRAVDYIHFNRQA